MEGGASFLNVGEDRPRHGRGRGVAAARRRWLEPARRSGGTGGRRRWGKGGEGRLRRDDRRVGELARGPDGREVAAWGGAEARRGGRDPMWRRADPAPAPMAAAPAPWAARRRRRLRARALPWWRQRAGLRSGCSRQRRVRPWPVRERRETPTIASASPLGRGVRLRAAKAGEERSSRPPWPRRGRIWGGGEGQRLGSGPPPGGNSRGRRRWSRADGCWGRRPAARWEGAAGGCSGRRGGKTLNLIL